jgi:hypothetical protein
MFNEGLFVNEDGEFQGNYNPYFQEESEKEDSF